MFKTTRAALTCLKISLAVTFAALSSVRERNVGTTDLFRVPPVGAVLFTSLGIGCAISIVSQTDRQAVLKLNRPDDHRPAGFFVGSYRGLKR